MSSVGVLALAMVVSCSSPPPPPAPATNRPAATPVSAAPDVTPPPEDPPWKYEGATGPDRWAALSPRFAACQVGQTQSPIDVVKPLRTLSPELRARFPPAELHVAQHEHLAEGLNTGHTIQINDAAADTLIAGDVKYQLVQYHFHGPSEHTIAGQQFPMEMHMVHMAQDGKLAVVGVLIEEGSRNAAFDPLWANLPKEKGAATSYPVTIDVGGLLPRSRATYRYEGSLTTPPCSEGVSWIMMSTPVQMSAEQIQAFTSLVENNNRPVQPLNGRAVVVDALGVRMKN